jgi:hypothetical protein
MKVRIPGKTAGRVNACPQAPDGAPRYPKPADGAATGEEDVSCRAWLFTGR